MELRGKLLSANREAVVICLLAVGLGLSTAVHAQTFTVLHSFTGGADGANPSYGLTLSTPGRLFGTAGQSAFQMRQYGAAWVLSPLAGLGAYAQSRLTVGPDGTLYGSVYEGLYNLRPPATTSPSVFPVWTETMIFQFNFFDGDGPMGDLVFDAAGNLYGTTYSGGVVNTCSGGLGCGTVYELSQSQGVWTNTRLYVLTGQSDGTAPMSGVLLDRAGNAYVTSSQGYYDIGAQWGAVFKLTPSGQRSWAETTLYDFQDGSGVIPAAGLISDPAGNLYGATVATSENDEGGTIYQLSPSGGGWTFDNLYMLSGGEGFRPGPRGRLVMDAAGNLYGTTYGDGAYEKGSVFELTPGMDGWNYVSLHDFSGGSDGANPMDGLVMDASGNLYGTTYAGGNTNGHCDASFGYQCGVVFEITP